MGSHSAPARARLLVICVCGLMVGLGAMLTTDSAMAVECSAITGSGSPLQTPLAEAWIASTVFSPCPKEVIEFNKPNATGNTAAQEEWGFITEALIPTRSANGSKLDGFIASDLPPTASELSKAVHAAGTFPITLPVASTPIAVILNPPSLCEFKLTSFNIPNVALEELFAGDYDAWKELLEAVGASEMKICGAAIAIEVRSDLASSSYYFKQYLDQIAPTVWANFVTSEVQWPTKTEAKTEHLEKGISTDNKGSAGEATAVLVTHGAVGYVNAADAVNAGFSEYPTKIETFWGAIQHNGLETKAPQYEGPLRKLKTTKKLVGTCLASSYSFSSKDAEERAKASPPVWAGIVLANVDSSGAYPICAFTYDLAWANYDAKALKYNTNLGTESTVKRYLSSVLNESIAEQGQSLISEGIVESYSPLPPNIAKLSNEILTKQV